MNSKLLAALAGAATILILFLILSANSNNRLVDFTIRSQGNRGVNTYYQVFTWKFTRPINPGQQKDLAQLVVFDPPVAGTFRLLKQAIVFSPDQVLRYGQNYSVTIKKQLQDVYAKPLTQDYVLHFQTKPLEFLGLKMVDGENELYLENLSDSGVPALQLAKAKNIKEYAADYLGNNIAYTIQPSDQGASDLYLYNQGNGSAQKLTLSTALNISSLQFDRFGNLLFLGATPDEELVGLRPEDVPDITNRIYKYDVATKQLQELSLLAKYYKDTIAMQVAPDGNTVLLQNYSYNIFLVSLLDGTSVQLGSYPELGQFSYDGRKLSLLKVDFNQANYVPQVQIYSGSQVIGSTSAQSYSRDPYLLADGNKVAFSERIQKIADSSEGLFGVRIGTLGADGISAGALLVTQANASLELPRVSPDRQWLAAERYDISQFADQARVVRRYVNPGRTVQTDLQLYQLNGDATGASFSQAVAGVYNLLWVH